MRTTITYLIVAAMLTGSAATARAGNPILTDPVLKGCLVSAKDNVLISAQQSGLLVKVFVTRDTYVPAKQKNEDGEMVRTLLAQIDDTEAQAAVRVARTQWQVADEEANNTVNERYSQKAFEVSQAEHEKALEANRRLPKTISQTEVERLRLTAQRSELQIEQSVMDRKIAGHTRNVRVEEWRAAMQNIEKRKIRAPFDGFVEEIYRKAGEWVREGDPVIQLVRLDELRVEGYVDAAKYNPTEVNGRKVEVTVTFARFETQIFYGLITGVSAQSQAGGKFRVSADVANVKKNGVWLLRHGSLAEMKILIK